MHTTGGRFFDKQKFLISTVYLSASPPPFSHFSLKENIASFE